jgi:hypothetical protein
VWRAMWAVWLVLALLTRAAYGRDIGTFVLFTGAAVTAAMRHTQCSCSEANLHFN